MFVDDEEVEEVERACVGDLARWAGSPAERREDAVRLGEEALAAVRDSRFSDAVLHLRALGELMVEDPALGLVESCEKVLKLVDEVCVAAASRVGVDPVGLQEILLTRFWVAWDTRESEELFLPLLGRVVAEGERGSARLANVARLQRGVELGRLGDVDRAVGDFDALIAAGSGALDRGGQEMVAAAWYEKCAAYCGAESWSATRAAARAYDSAYSALKPPGYGYRVRLAEARWMDCIALARESFARDGVRDDEADQELDALIGWLRAQPEVGLRRLLVHRLADRMRWLARDPEVLRVLAEMVELVGELDDPMITRHVGRRVVDQMPDLIDDTLDTIEVIAAAVAETLGSEEAPSPRGCHYVLDDETVLRTSRVVAALSHLAERLRADPDPRAAPVLAVVVINLMMLLGRLGRRAEQMEVAEELPALGDAAVGACDAIAAQGVEIAAPGVLSASLLTMPFLKALILAEQGREEDAAGSLTELLARASGHDEPWVRALCRQATALRDQLTA